MTIEKKRRAAWGASIKKEKKAAWGCFYKRFSINGTNSMYFPKS